MVYTMRSHQDTITSLALSPDGQTLASNSMDNTVRVWDVRAFAPSNRLIHTFSEAPHSGLEKNLIRASWSPAGDKLAAGSGDRSVVCAPIFISFMSIITINQGYLGYRLEKAALQASRTSWNCQRCTVLAE